MSSPESDPDPDAEIVTRKAGRPRSAQSHQAILNATLELFAEVGFQGMSIEGIAERAGVGKTTIYRRWSSKEDLVKDAVNMMRIDGAIIPDTGNIRNDLLHILTIGMAVRENTPFLEKIVFRLLAEIKSNPDFGQFFYNQLMASRIEQAMNLIKRAQARGELRSDLDPMLMLTFISGPMFYEIFFSDIFHMGAPLAFKPEEAIDAILNGIGALPSDQPQPKTT